MCNFGISICDDGSDGVFEGGVNGVIFKKGELDRSYGSSNGKDGLECEKNKVVNCGLG